MDIRYAKNFLSRTYTRLIKSKQYTVMWTEW